MCLEEGVQAAGEPNRRLLLEQQQEWQLLVLQACQTWLHSRRRASSDHSVQGCFVVADHSCEQCWSRLPIHQEHLHSHSEICFPNLPEIRPNRLLQGGQTWHLPIGTACVALGLLVAFGNLVRCLAECRASQVVEAEVAEDQRQQDHC